MRRVRSSSWRPSSICSALEGDECFGHGVIVRERLGERPAVGGGLRRAGRGVRANHPGGVTDEADPTERHARYLDVVDHLQERLLDGP